MQASSNTAPTMMDMVRGSQALVAIPRTVPDAGGCSVLVTAIKKIRIPTESASAKFRTNVPSCGKKSNWDENNSQEKAEPTRRPRTWPPISERGVPDRLEGCMNTMRTLDANPAAIAASDNESTKSRTASIAVVASPAWTQYALGERRNCGSIMRRLTEI